MSKADQPKTRIEKDSLGELHVPIDAHYGAQTQRAVLNFPVSGLRLPRHFIRAMGLMKHACAHTNVQLGLLDKTIGDAIQRVSLDVAEGLYDEHFPVDIFQTGSGTSSNMNANEVIARLATQQCDTLVHPNNHVNMGQSSNDVFPSCMHVCAALLVSEQLLPSLEHLALTIEAKAASVQGITKTGRTHLMDAMPITLTQELMAWAHQIRVSHQRLAYGLTNMTALAIGGTAVGTGINTPPQFGQHVCDLLSTLSTCDFYPNANLCAAVSSQDTAVEMSGHLKTLAVGLMKIANDLRWMNSGPLAGLAEISLPAVQPGSSIMPGKVNPVIPESISMACAQVMGNDTTITVAAQSGNFQLNVMMPVIAYNLVQSIEILANGAQILADNAISHFTVNTENIDANLRANPVLITALNKMIGYDKGAEIAKIAFKEKRAIFDVAKEMTDIDEATLTTLLDPANLTGKENNANKTKTNTSINRAKTKSTDGKR